MDTDNMSTEISKHFEDNITLFARFRDQLDQTKNVTENLPTISPIN